MKIAFMSDYQIYFFYPFHFAFNSMYLLAPLGIVANELQRYNFF